MRFLVCLSVLVLMMGCGSSEKAEEKVAEKIAEKAIAAQTGKKVDIDIDKERMQIKTEDGEMTLTSGESAKIPDTFPKDIPIYRDLFWIWRWRFLTDTHSVLRPEMTFQRCRSGM